MSIGEQIKRSSSLPRAAREGGRRSETTAAGWGRLIRENVVAYLALFRRKPRPLRATPATLLQLIIWTAAAIGLIGAAMYLVDARAVGIAQRLPPWVNALAD